jgi:holo-[acyl-carrier protein] synthase
MEIVRKDSGEPAVLLTGAGKAFAEANGIGEVKISLSHAHHYAAANAVALGV